MSEIRYTPEVVSDVPDLQVARSVQLMAEYARRDSTSPTVAALALRLTDSLSPYTTVANIWQYVNSNIRFQADYITARALPQAADDVVIEVFVRPVDMLAMIETQGQGVGDCDDFTMLVCSLLIASGIECSIVTIADAQSAQPDIQSHVYAVAHVAGQRIPLDASHGLWPGWEAPAARISRINEYPVNRNGTLADGLGVVLLAGAVLAYVYRHKLSAGWSRVSTALKLERLLA